MRALSANGHSVARTRDQAPGRRVRVVFERYAILPYRVLFFAALAEEVADLLVASTERPFDGVTGLRRSQVRDFVARCRRFDSSWRKPRTSLGWRNKRRHLLGLDGFAMCPSHSAGHYAAVYDAPASGSASPASRGMHAPWVTK